MLYIFMIQCGFSLTAYTTAVVILVEGLSYLEIGEISFRMYDEQLESVFPDLHTLHLSYCVTGTHGEMQNGI